MIDEPIKRGQFLTVINISNRKSYFALLPIDNTATGSESTEFMREGWHGFTEDEAKEINHSHGDLIIPE